MPHPYFLCLQIWINNKKKTNRASTIKNHNHNHKNLNGILLQSASPEATRIFLGLSLSPFGLIQFGPSSIPLEVMIFIDINPHPPPPWLSTKRSITHRSLNQKLHGHLSNLIWPNNMKNLNIVIKIKKTKELLEWQQFEGLSHVSHIEISWKV